MLGCTVRTFLWFLLVWGQALVRAAVVVDVADAVMAEGASLQYTVHLTSPPESNFTLQMSLTTTPPQMVTLVSIMPPSINFTTANWRDAQSLALTSTSSAAAVGSFEGSVLHSQASDDPRFNSTDILPDPSFSFRVVEQDRVGILCTASTTLLFSTANTSKLTCNLLSMPAANVVVSGSFVNAGPFSLKPSELFWTASNYSEVATAELSSDLNSFRGSVTSTLVLSALSADPSYNQLAPIPSDRIEVNSLGSTELFAVVFFATAVAVEGADAHIQTFLSKAPKDAVEIVLDHPAWLQPLDKNRTVFNTSNWNVRQDIRFFVSPGAQAANGGTTAHVTASAFSLHPRSTVHVVPQNTLSVQVVVPDSECQLKCPAGSFAVDVAGSLVCQQCFAGRFCPGGCSGQMSCPVGSFSNTSGAALAQNCSTCPPGHFASRPGSTSCGKCPANFFCSDPREHPEPCPSGSVAAEGSISCVACPAGHSCLSTLAGNQPCPAGTYSLPNGATPCISCPPGHQCSGRTIAPKQCSSGFFSGPGQSLCSECPFGTYSATNGSSVCSACPAGYRCGAGSTMPTECPLGTFSAPNSHQCLACALGTFSNETASDRCWPCPPGAACPSKAARPVPCGAGTISSEYDPSCELCSVGTTANAARTACVACPVGHSCPNPSEPPHPCPAGTYTNQSHGASVCLQCPIGLSCPGLAAPPLRCPSGLFPAFANTSCSPCPAGFECSTGDTGFVQQHCPRGTFQDGSFASCQPCPLGFVCPTADQRPAACPSHAMPNKNQTACRACQPGYSCSSSLAHECAPGHYWDQMSSCVPCPAGYMCSTPRAPPLPCPPGTYQPHAAMQNCTECPAGFACAGATSVLQACPTGFVSPPTAISCTACPAGYECPSSDWRRIAVCPIGTVSLSGEASCFACPAGKECPHTTSAFQRPCALGRYSTGGSAACELCPENFACENPTGGFIVPCPVGLVSPVGYATCIAPSTGGMANLDASGGCGPGTFALNETHCTDCPAGQACPKTGDAFSFFCPAGSFSLGGQSTCTPCPPGFFCTDTTLDTMSACQPGRYSLGGLSECKSCPAGYSCGPGTELPRRCTAGRYSAAEATNCAQCPAGSYCSFSAGTTSLPLACPRGTWSAANATRCQPSHAGFVSPAGSAVGFHPDWAVPAGRYQQYQPSLDFGVVSVSVLCPPGRFGDERGAISIPAGCPFTCPAGSFCESGTSNATIAQCPPGAFCEYGESEPALCPAGRFSSSTGNTALANCLVCTAGRACPSEGTVAPIRCFAGYYCPDGSTSPTTFPCPAGTFQPLDQQSSANACQSCLPGAYCTTGSIAPQLCPIGTYSNKFNLTHVQQCMPCPAGVTCSRRGLLQPDGLCAAGYYCPRGSGNQFDYPCPAGKYSHGVNLTSAEECDVCPAGYACRPGTGGAQPMTRCPPGYFCPNGTMDPHFFRCPSGKFSSRTGLTSAAACDPCTAGRFCTGGMTATSGPCAHGHFCPQGTKRSTQFPCPSGRFGASSNLTSDNECLECPAAQYCPLASPLPIDCPAGTFSNRTGIETANWQLGGNVSCEACPAGKHCTVRSLHPRACLPGTFSSRNATRCSTCPTSHYCPEFNTTEERMLLNTCPAGVFCPAGTPSINPAVHNCTRGHYCPEAALEEIPCAPGTFAASRGMSLCNVCPPGMFCLAAAAAPNGACEPGHYCPAGSSSAQAEWCPLGTYNAASGSAGIESCQECPAGFFCGGGTVVPEKCPAGSFCPSLSWHPQPCPAGTFGNSSGLQKQTDCTPCLLGMFCDESGLKAPVGLCDPGFFCTRGSPTSSPTSPGPPWVSQDLTYGGVCPRGGFCPSGSFEPTPCPLGTYSNISGAANHEDCQRCPAGFYCAFTAKPEPTGPCLAGFYCGVGSNSSRQHVAPEGHFAPEGSPAATKCRPGSFAASKGMAECDLCPAGYQCPSEGVIAPTRCNAGTFCPEGTDVAHLCPAGTFSPQNGAGNASSCLLCPPGKYCQFSGLSEPTGDCQAGFICTGGSALPDPDQRQGGYICPAGAYCTAAATTPLGCPLGTFSAVLGLKSPAECQPCLPGTFCNATGLLEPQGECEPGYFCGSAATSAMPVGVQGMTANGHCAAGYECPAGSSAPTPCAPGTFSNTSRTAHCSACPAGFSCHQRATQSPEACDKGTYCPVGSVLPLLCPEGTFGALWRLERREDCSACPRGKACTQPGLSQPDEECAAGFWCSGGAATVHGHTTGALNESSLCPPGSFCPTGTSAPTPCPPGTASSQSGLSGAHECALCPPGRYCGRAGLTVPSGDCAQGYYCTLGSPESRPTGIVFDVQLQKHVGGSVCPEGHFCVAGSAAPQPCPAGTYMPTNGSHGPCTSCTAGYTCSIGTEIPNTACPAGHFCPAGTGTSAARACPPGTFNPFIGGTNSSSCQQCTPGKYCHNSGNIVPSGFCSAGYFCGGGAASATPQSDLTNGRCQPGTLCPAGTVQPIECPSGHFCAHAYSNVSGQCAAGFFCLRASPVARPVQLADANGFIGDLCPRGSFCRLGTVSPTLCPAGSFNEAYGGKSIADCAPCPAGRVCPSPGTVSPRLCDAGYMCSGGDSASLILCPVGQFCSEGVHIGTPCPPGSFANSTGQAICSGCPAGYMCPTLETVKPQLCPPGRYCLENTTNAEDSKCPVGRYSSNKGLSQPHDCSRCPPGFFCSEEGAVAPGGLCSKGFFCRAGATAAKPTSASVLGYQCAQLLQFAGSSMVGPFSYAPWASADRCEEARVWTNTTLFNEIEGGPCPQGHFCPMGSSHPEPCPAGRYGPTAALGSQDDCSPCEAGMYCPMHGMVRSGPPCPVGFVCPQGTHTPMPNCTIGHFCPEGSSTPMPCPAGRYSARPGRVPECESCPPGKVCGLGAFSPNACPRGFVCPGNSTTTSAVPCPPGSFGEFASLQSITECSICLPGHYCPQEGATAPYGLVAAGFFSTGGAASSTPSEASGRGLCPAGHFCPEGAPNPFACPAGRFSSQRGLNREQQCELCAQGTVCHTPGATTNSVMCPKLHYCPLGTAKIVNETLCPASHTCPEGTLAPIPCPAGTFTAAAGSATCSTCHAGKVCPAGDPAPYDCQPGRFCPPGTAPDTQQECPAGTFRNTPAASSIADCQACTPGSYCPISGGTSPAGLCAGGYFCASSSQSSMPTDGATGALCDAGYVCPPGSSSPTPNGTGTGSPCPAGHFCPRGSAIPVACPAGTFRASVGGTDCSVCPAGAICPHGTIQPQPCPIGKFCPVGSASGEVCEPGTYSIRTGLLAAAQCQSCPPGRYCTAGEIQGPCDAGFVCFGGSPYPRPTNPALGGSECPPGNYCPEGTIAPVLCANGTFRGSTGGTRQADCGACEPGYICFDGNPAPHICPRGYFCNSVVVAAACPAGTYQPAPGAADESACKTCPGGFVCSEQGAFNFTKSMCPPGHFCPAGSTVASPCPPGTRSQAFGGNSIEDCQVCPAGLACETNATVSGLICPGGYECRPGTVKPLACSAGWLCPVGTKTAVQCPPGHYCPGKTENAQICPPGTFCEAGSVMPAECPPGFKAQRRSYPGLFTSMGEACERCPPGMSSDLNGTQCLPCDGGFVCLAGSTSLRPTNVDEQRGYICPQGHFCPPGSFDPVACPAGTFNQLVAQSSIKDCVLCPVNSYSSTPGSTGCEICSASATSGRGATACKCIGFKRIYQPSDGQCICEPGFEFVDDQFNRIPDEDGTGDCQPVVYSRCIAGQVRSSNGKCVSDCANECGTNGGKLIGSSGVCECDGTRSLENLCNADCRRQADRQIMLEASEAGQNRQYVVILRYNARSRQDESFVYTWDEWGISGSAACVGQQADLRSELEAAASQHLQDDGHSTNISLATAWCKMESIATRNGEFTGAYQQRSLVRPNFALVLHGDAIAVRHSVAARQLQVTAAPAIQSIIIPNPVICMQLFDSLVFDLTSAASWPVYDKDSLLNTNPAFDYGAFRALQKDMQSGANYSNFIFTFTAPGVHMFVSSGSQSKRMIVRIVAEGVQCPIASGSVLPASEESLILVGIKVNDQVLTDVDWNKVFAIVASLLFVATSLVWVSRSNAVQDWSRQNFRALQYRRESKLSDLGLYHSKGGINSIHLRRDDIAEPAASAQSSKHADSEDASSIEDRTEQPRSNQSSENNNPFERKSGVRHLCAAVRLPRRLTLKPINIEAWEGDDISMAETMEAVQLHRLYTEQALESTIGLQLGLLDTVQVRFQALGRQVQVSHAAHRNSAVLAASGTDASSMYFEKVQFLQKAQNCLHPLQQAIECCASIDDHATQCLEQIMVVSGLHLDQFTTSKTPLKAKHCLKKVIKSMAEVVNNNLKAMHDDMMEIKATATATSPKPVTLERILSSRSTQSPPDSPTKRMLAFAATSTRSLFSFSGESSPLAKIANPIEKLSPRVGRPVLSESHLASGWNLDKKVSTQPIMPMPLFEQFTALDALLFELNTLEVCAGRAVELQAMLGPSNIEDLKALWMHAPSFAARSDIHQLKQIADLVVLAEEFLASLGGACAALSEFASIAVEVQKQLHDTQRKLAHSASRHAIDTLTDMFAEERVVAVNEEDFLNQQQQSAAQAAFCSCWNACTNLVQRTRATTLAADKMKQALNQTLSVIERHSVQEVSQLQADAATQGLSFFRFNERLRTLEELVGQLNAQQYYDEHNEADEEAYYEEENQHEHDESDQYADQSMDAEGAFSDEQYDEVQAEEIQEVQAEEFLSEDAKSRLLNDLADDAGELHQILQEEYEQQQYELNAALAQDADNEADEQMRRFLHEAEFIDEQEAAVVSLDQQQEEDLNAALQSMLESDEFNEGRKGFFKAATWDGQEEDLSEYAALGAGLVETDAVDQALLDAERIRNERNAEAANCEAQQQREQTRQLQALKRKLESRKLARMAALDRKLASDAEQGYSEADAAYLAGEAQVKANEQAAVDEAELIRQHEQTKVKNLASATQELSRSTLQQYEEVASNLQAAQGVAAKTLAQAEGNIQAKVEGIENRIREEMDKAVSDDERQLLNMELAAAREQAATELAAATAEVQQRMLAMKTALQLEKANALAVQEAHALSEKLNGELQAQLEKQHQEMAAAQEALRVQHQAELDRLRLQQQDELAAAATTADAEALSARHQLEEEQLRAASMIERHERLGDIKTAHAGEQDNLRQQADQALAEFTKHQTEANIARAHAQKQQLSALQQKLQRRQQRRAEATKTRHAEELALAKRRGEDVDALKRKHETEEAAKAAQEAAALGKIAQADTSAAEAAAVRSASACLQQLSDIVTTKQQSNHDDVGSDAQSAQAAREHLQQVDAAISNFKAAYDAGETEAAAREAFDAASSLAEVRQRGELDRVKLAREQYLAGIEAEEQREKDFMLQARRIQQQYEQEQKKLVNTVGTEKMRQANAAHERMMERKQRRAAALERQQQEQRAKVIEQQKRAFEERLQAKSHTSDQREQSSVDALVAEVQAETATAAMTHVTEQVNDAKSRHEAKMAALRQKHDNELDQLRQEAEEQAALAAREAEEAAERRRQERLQILASEMEEQQQWGTSQEQADAIKKKYDENVAQLSSALDQERGRQQKQLQKQLAVRKQRQLRKAQKRQEAELAQLNREQEANLAAIQSSSDKKRDLAALRRVLSTSGTASAKQRGAAIEGVLRTRHGNETRAMLERQFHERNNQLKASVSSILQDKAAEKREMLGMLEESGATPDEMEAALADLNDKYSHSIGMAKQDIHTELEAKHAAELAELRRAQMAELTDAFAQLSPQDVLRRQQAAEREEQAAQMEATKKRLLLEREKKLEAAARLREQKQAEMQRAKEAAQKQLREEMAAHLKTEERRASLQMQRQKERAEREAQEHMQQQLVMHDGDEEYKQKLLQEFKQNQAAMAVALSAERQRQAKAMHERLAKRKERKMRAAERKLNQAARDAEKIVLKKQAPTRPRGAAGKPKAKEATSASPAASRNTPQRSVRSKATPSGRPPRPQVAASAAAKALSQAVLGRIEHIEAALQVLTKQKAAILPMQQAPAQAAADVFEAHLQNGVSLRETDPAHLKPEQKAMLQFAADLFRTIASSLNSSGRLSTCTVQVAEELPSNLVDSNAFRRSYWFDAENNTLFVHEKRFEPTAGLPTVLAHAAAHILSDPATMGPDSSPAFQAMHAQVMQAALGQLVSHAQHQHSSPKRVSPATGMAVLSPAQSNVGDDVPRLSLNFGMGDAVAALGARPAASSPQHKEKQPVRSKRAAKLFRSLSSRSKLFQVGAAGSARKRALRLEQAAEQVAADAE